MRGSKVVKKITALTLAAFMLTGRMPALPLAEVHGADSVIGSTSSWAEPYLQKLFDLGVMRGDQEGNLDPNRDITRAEFISMLNRAFGYDSFTRTGKSPFKDVKGTEWYADDITIASQQGYLIGDNKGRANPDGSLTRQEAVAFINRNLKIEDVPGENLDFVDGRSFPTWSSGSINAATKKGYVSGYEDKTFRPLKNITRGEAAKIFADALGELCMEPGDKTLGNVDGNITVSTSGITLRDTIINGDLYITDGIGTGYVNFENVTVLGQVIVSGCGESNAGNPSINFNNSAINALVVDGPEDKLITFKATGTTIVNSAIVKSNTYIENDGRGSFGPITQKGIEDSELHLNGDFTTVTILNPSNNFFMDKGDLDKLIVDEDAEESTAFIDYDAYIGEVDLDIGTEITGQGEIGTLVVNASDTTVEMLPDYITIRPGITANINGKEMTSRDAEMASSLPRILSKYPTMDEIAPTSANAIYKTNKPGTLYWAVTLEDEDTLSKEEIMKPKQVKSVLKSGALSIAKGEEEYTIKVSGLQADTEYSISAVFVDERDDESQRKTEDFTTVDNVVPKFLSGYPTVSKASNTSMDVSVATSKDCKVYWAVFPTTAVKPTALELKKGKTKGDIDNGTESGLKMNEAETFTVSGLEEATNYNMYLLASDGENDSNIVQVTLNTLDKTAPKFLATYPRSDKITQNSVDVKYNVDEAGTIFYVVCKKGTEYPVPIPPATAPPALDSEEAKQAVVTGNNAFKSGKASASANNEGTLKVGSLEPETSYDLYLCVQDKSGNTSPVVKMGIKTTDVIPPTVTQEFEELINNYPTVDSDIRIVFSEEVWDQNTRDSITPESLEESQNIVLYDMTVDKKTTVPLDFSKAKIELSEEGKTIVTLSKEVTNLKTGNDYQFEINKIVDTSGNKMSDKTLLEKFSTVPPLVEISKTVEQDDMDMTFELNPQSVNTADNVLYDMIFYSNSNITFDLYEKNSSGTFEPITGIVADENGDIYSPLVYEGEAITLHYILDRQIEGLDDYVFEPFNGLESKEYGIKLLSVDGDTVKDSWNANVEIQIKCVIGSKSNLSMIAGNPVKNLDTAVKAGAKIVNDPAEFFMLKAFTDTAIPKFLDGYPKFDIVGDVIIYPVVATDRKAEFFYLIAPLGAITKEPSALDIMRDAISVHDGFTGHTTINNGNIEVEVPIGDLTPNTTYDIYYFLKGTPAETSPMYHTTVKTSEIAPPVIQLTVNDRGENFVNVAITVDKSSTVDWIVFQRDKAPPFDPITTNDNPVAKEQFTTIIRNGAETTTYVPIAFGTQKITVKKGQTSATVIVPVSGLERPMYYTFYAVGKSDLGSRDSRIEALEGITPKDTTPPTAKVETVIGNPYASQSPYKGAATITFNEPLFYIPGEASKPEPLTFEIFKEYFSGTILEDSSITVSDRNYQENPVKDDDGNNMTWEDENGNEHTVVALQRVQIDFKDVLGNFTANFPYEVCDKSGNVAGKLYMTFVDNEDSEGKNRVKSTWALEFVRES